MQLQDYVNNVQEMLHDTTSVVWPLSRVISRINDARLDAARDIQCVRQNVTGVQLVQNQEIYNLTGAVCGATIIAGGSNYTNISITFQNPPPGGVQAQATGILTNGSLTGITMTQWGSGYTTAPFIFVSGNGSGATLFPVCLFQTNPNTLSTAAPIGQPLVVNGISYIWNGERRSLKYAAFSLFQAYARMWVQNFIAPPGIFTHQQQQQLVYIQPPPDQNYLSEWDVVFMPYQLIALADVDTNLVDPWSRAVQFKACEYLLYKLRNQGQVMEMGQEYDKYVPRIITTSGGIRVPNIYNRNFQRRMMR